MRAAPSHLLFLLLLPALASAGTDAGGLGSSYLEVRRTAARRMAHAGPAGVEALRAGYAGADFRTRALILDALAEAAPPEGLPLVCADLGTPSREVALAQRRIVSAMYARVQAYVRRWILPLLPKGDWQLEEHVRALPGPGPSPRAALAWLVRDSDGARRARLEALAERVADVDAIRAEMAWARRSGDPHRAAHARDLRLRLLQHDVERALLAVDEAGAAGYYDGLYDTVEELRDPAAMVEGEDAVSVLLHLLRNEPLPESGTTHDRGRWYRLLETPPVEFDQTVMISLAASCLGDIADPSLAPVLQEHFESLPVPDYPWENERRETAHACAALGDPEPLETLVSEWRADLFRGYTREWKSRVATWIAAAKARMGRYDEAVEQYRQADAWLPGSSNIHYNLACAFSMGGRPEAAFRELRRAVALGYGTNAEDLAWMGRDRDLAAVRRLPGYAAWAASLHR